MLNCCAICCRTPVEHSPRSTNTHEDTRNYLHFSCVFVCVRGFSSDVLVVNHTDFALEARRGHPEGTRAPPSLQRWGLWGRPRAHTHSVPGLAPQTPTQHKHCGKP